MRVSVITPLYNQAEFVREAIISVQAQKYPKNDLEHIVLDDASTDGASFQAATACKSMYHPQRLRVDRHRTNKGVAEARNTAIGMALGDLILTLDADDWISPDYVAKTVPMIRDGADAVVTWMHIVPTWQMITWHAHSEQFVGAPDTSYPIFAPTREQILNGNCLPVCGLFKKSLLKRLGGYPTTISGLIADWGMWAKIVCSGAKIAVLQEHLFHYRVQGASISRTSVDSIEDSRRAIGALCASL